MQQVCRGVVLLEGKTPQEPVSSRIIDNFEFFTEQMATADVVTVYQGIQKLMIFDVRLQQGVDNPQMIFESMNSTGKALTQADLIRNFVIMGLQHDLQTFLYNAYWRPMEINFGAENYNNQFDDFMLFSWSSTPATIRSGKAMFITSSRATSASIMSKLFWPL